MTVTANLIYPGNKILVGKAACTVETVNPITGTAKIEITYRNARGQLRRKVVDANQMVKIA